MPLNMDCDGHLAYCHLSGYYQFLKIWFYIDTSGIVLESYLIASEVSEGALVFTQKGQLYL